jgi:hypothetical protein
MYSSKRSDHITTWNTVRKILTSLLSWEKFVNLNVVIADLTLKKNIIKILSWRTAGKFLFTLTDNKE